VLSRERKRRPTSHRSPPPRPSRRASA
jgi:hypothetical protein